MSDKEVWIAKFVEELVRLRPHLDGTSKVVQTIAINARAMHGDLAPEDAAKRWTADKRAAPAKPGETTRQQR